jgi:hypothetical protein
LCIVSFHIRFVIEKRLPPEKWNSLFFFTSPLSDILPPPCFASRIVFQTGDDSPPEAVMTGQQTPSSSTYILQADKQKEMTKKHLSLSDHFGEMRLSQKRVILRLTRDLPKNERCLSGDCESSPQ